jgi:hypothetical protein
MVKVYIELTINNLQKKNIPKVGKMKLIYKSSRILILGMPPPIPTHTHQLRALCYSNSWQDFINPWNPENNNNPMNLSVYSKGFFSSKFSSRFIGGGS